MKSGKLRGMDMAMVVLIAGIIGGGVMGAVVRGWSILSRLFALETRVNDMEGVQLRLQNQFKAEKRWDRPKNSEVDAELVKALVASAKTPKPVANWWSNYAPPGKQ